MKIVEALEHEGAVIAELGQSGHDVRPVDHPAARDTAMALGEMNIAEEVSGGSETGCETLLLDIHVIGVEMDEQIVGAGLLDDLTRVARPVEKVRFIAVARLNADREAAGPGRAGGSGVLEGLSF